MIALIGSIAPTTLKNVEETFSEDLMKGIKIAFNISTDDVLNAFEVFTHQSYQGCSTTVEPLISTEQLENEIKDFLESSK